jgi:hypothetical protein
MTTPVTRAVVNAYEGETPDDLNQLLGTHAAQTQWGVSTSAGTESIYPGPIGFSELNTFYNEELAVTYAQPITLSGNIYNVTLPVSVATGLGCDMLVGLYNGYATNGFPIGQPLAQTFVPREALQALPTLPYVTDWWTPPNLTNLPSPYNTYYYFGGASDGISLVLVGGYNGTTITSSVVTALLETDDIETWMMQPSLPQAVFSPAVVCYGGNVYVIGGTIAGATATSAVYSASLDQTGTIGAWSEQTSLPIAIGEASACVVNGWLFVAGGQLTGGAASSAVYAASLTDGFISEWTAQASLPLAVFDAQLVACNDWLISIGGYNGSSVPVTNVYASNASDGIVQSWQSFPSLPQALEGFPAVVSGSTIYVGGFGYTTGNVFDGQVFTLQVESAGAVGQWQWGTEAGANSSNVSCLTSTGVWLVAAGGAGSLAAAAQTGTSTLLNVPLYATGLATAVYFVVISPVRDADDANTAQIISSTDNPGLYAYPYPSSALQLVGEGTWGQLPDSGYIPIGCATQGQSSLPLHITQDTTHGQPLAWNWLVYNVNGSLIQAFESSLPLINLLSNNASTFGGAVEGDTTSWTPTNATMTLVQLL